MDSYTEELVEVLKKTEFRKDENSYTYEEGIKLLVDIFTEKRLSVDNCSQST